MLLNPLDTLNNITAPNVPTNVHRLNLVEIVLFPEAKK